MLQGACLAWPSWPWVCSLGMTAWAADWARLLRASCPSSATRADASCPSKILAAWLGSSCSVPSPAQHGHTRMMHGMLVRPHRHRHRDTDSSVPEHHYQVGCSAKLAHHKHTCVSDICPVHVCLAATHHTAAGTLHWPKCHHACNSLCCCLFSMCQEHGSIKFQ